MEHMIVINVYDQAYENPKDKTKHARNWLQCLLPPIDVATT